MFQPLHTVTFGLIFALSLAYAGPTIEFDTKTYDCGFVIEGKTERLHATFIVKNSGDSVLAIERVQPGCGCTMVHYDSIVQPGETVKIQSQVRIKGFRPGLLSKKIIVTSNAVNEQTSRLTIRATIRPIVGTIEDFISIATDDSSTITSLYLTSIKKGLKISSVVFHPHSTTIVSSGKQKKFTPLKFNFTPSDSLAADGNHLFRLDLYQPESAAATGKGEFIITTNNRQRQQIKLFGKIGP